MPIETFAGKGISSTYQRVVQTDGTYLADGTGSLINNITIPGNLVVSGTLYAENTVIVTQSFSSGSNILGDAADDFQTLYGTVRIPTGSLTVTGSTDISGSVTAKGVFISTTTYPTVQGFVTSGSAVSTVGVHTNVWRGTYTGTAFSYVANAYTSSVDNLILAGTRPATPTFAQFQLYVKTDNTTVFNVGGGGPILDIANNGTPYARFDGTNFSIGATTALSRLYAKGTGTTSATTAFRVDNANASASLVVLDDGNVGIGTSTPTQLLDINAGSAASALVKFTAGSGVNKAQVGFLTGYGAVVGATSGNSIFVHGTNIMFRSHDLLTEWMRINNSGVGIGTTSISASLHISGASTANLLRIDSPATSSIIYVSGSGAIGFNQTSSLNAQATFRGVQGSLNFTEINTTANGGYGLRTDGPIKANGYYFYNAGGGNILTAGGVSMMFFDSALNVGIAVSSSVGARLHIRGAGTTSATNALLVQNANASSSLVVRDDGRVGVGTISPSRELTVVDTTTAAGIAIDSSTQSDNFYIEASKAGLPRFSIYENSDIIYINSHNRMTFRANQLGGSGGSIAFIQGNVGVGTTTPVSKLTVFEGATTLRGAGGASNTILEIIQNTGSVAGAHFIGDGGNDTRFELRRTVDGFTQTRLRPSADSYINALVGNVGIGTATPTARLHVSGSPGTGSAVTIYKSGSTALDIQGSSGQLFAVTDSLTGSLFSVNTAAGLPTIEAFSDNTVNIGKFGSYPIKVVSLGTAADITGSFSGSIRATSITLTGSLNVSGSQNYVGDVNINGTLTATVKSFLIEHPTQPGKKLQYGNLEGPEHAVYFRGRSTSSIIELPEEWTGLVDEESITVQLTSIGKFQPLYVSNITSTRVEIQVSEPTSLNYHYLIHGERKDIDKLITTIN